MTTATRPTSYHVAVVVTRGDKSTPTGNRSVVCVSVDSSGIRVNGLPGGRRYLTGNRVNLPRVGIGSTLNVASSGSRSLVMQVKSTPYAAPHGTTGVLRSLSGISLSFDDCGSYVVRRSIDGREVAIWQSDPMLTPSSPEAVAALEAGIRRYEAALQRYA